MGRVCWWDPQSAIRERRDTIRSVSGALVRARACSVAPRLQRANGSRSWESVPPAFNAARGRAGVPPNYELAAVHGLLTRLDPERSPGVVDQRRIEHIIEGLSACARGSSML